MPLTYHYCSLETACAIISNASLRLCDITKSNDSAEITYGYAAAMDSHKRIGPISGSGPTLEFADHWIELLRPEYQTLLREALSRHLLPPNRLCYAVCLSERADQLSQWRAYGDDGRGVALGFDLSTFAQREPSFTVCSDDGHPLETHMMTLYRPIVYGRERSTECFDELAARMARNVHDLRAASTRTQDAVRARLLDATLEFIAATAFCKKRFFHEEREWRLAIWGAECEHRRFRDAAGGTGPRVASTFPRYGDPCAVHRAAAHGPARADD